MNKSLAVLLMSLLLVAVVIAGCRESAQPVESDPDLTIDLRIDPEPPAMGEATLLVTLATIGGEPVTGAAVSVRGDMDHAGMVPVLGSAEETDEPGVYSVPFEWTMGGDWIVTVTVTQADGEVGTEDFNLTVSSAGNDAEMDHDMDDIDDMDDMEHDDEG